MQEEIIEEIMDWLKSEYIRKGRNFSFKSVDVEKNIKISRWVVGRNLSRAKKVGKPLVIISTSNTRCNKWRTNFKKVKE